MSKIKYVNLGDLNLPSFQAHRNIPPEHIKEISESIKSIGVIEPLIVRHSEDGLEIVAGCVRYHAAILAGLKAVPCINMSLDPKSAEVLKLHENVKRIPLDHVDQGHTFLMMMDTFQMTEKDIAECSGKSISYVSQHISLVRLDNELTSAVKEGSISFSQARELMRVDDHLERQRLMRYCQEDGATIQVLQSWIQQHLRSLEKTPEQISPSPDSSLSQESSKIAYICEACDKPIQISQIKQVIYCPTCHTAIKNAISDEKKRLSENTTEKTP